MTRPAPTAAEIREQKLLAPAREAKLPPWAQKTINTLRAQVAALAQENARLKEQS